MGSLSDVIASLDWIDRLEGLVSSFLNADWTGAHQRSGLLGLAEELGRSASGANRRTIRVPRNCGWSGGQIELFLGHYGVVLWGRGFTADDIYFSVKERQADWAEYLLIRRGIPLSGSLINASNARYAEAYAPGDQPPAWADQDHKPEHRSDGFLDFFG